MYKSQRLSIGSQALIACLTMLSATVAHSQALPDAIAKSRTIKVAVNAIYPPMEYKDPESGDLVGFDIDLGNAIAKELNVKLDWHESAFEQLLPSLTSGRVDMVLSGVSDLPARHASVDFLDYFSSGAQFYVLSSTENEFKKPTDLCGKSVGTSRSTSFPADIKAWSEKNCVGKAPIDVIGTEDTSAARLQLKQKRIAGGVQGSETLPYNMKLEPNTFKPLGGPFAISPMGIAFAKNNTALRDAVHGALDKLIENGTYSKIATKWALQSSRVEKITLNGK
ncbi:ABC transporter substrate-binding protein [Paraburkholderia sp. BR10882]|uniref:ABC transporter substrate-binding protein n=1 Tax=unclassified Paraburkholderia TaxID=2615204 RepID=UPI0034CDF90B